MFDIEIESFDSIDSTNDQAMYQIEKFKLSKDKIIIARHQSNGHGANGHSFISDSNVGIYFTFIHFYKDTKELSFITQKAAVAIYETFKDIFNIDLSIKWINDLYYKNKKIAGILCRNLIKYNAVIVGIGIDLFYNKSLDQSIKDIAGYIFKDTDELISTFDNNNKLNNDNMIYYDIYKDFKNKKIYTFNKDFLWSANFLVTYIVEKLLYYIDIEGLPIIYIEKNIIKDGKIYEDCILEC